MGLAGLSEWEWIQDAARKYVCAVLWCGWRSSAGMEGVWCGVGGMGKLKNCQKNRGKEKQIMFNVFEKYWHHHIETGGRFHKG